MKKVFTIYDVFRTPTNELVICGVNTDEPFSVEDMKLLANNQVKVITPDQKEQLIDVVGVEISQSLVNKKNIFLKIKGWVGADNTVINATVYSIK